MLDTELIVIFVKMNHSYKRLVYNGNNSNTLK